MFVLDEMGNGTQERLEKYFQYISRICLNIQSIYSEQPDRKLGPVCTPKCENRLECLVSSYNWRSTKYNLQILPPHMRGAQEDLYWRVCRIMTKDGAQEVFLGRHHPTFSPIISPKKPPHTPQCPTSCVAPKRVNHPCDPAPGHKFHLWLLTKE